MKLVLILALGCLTASASTFEVDEKRQHGENGWYVPQKNGSFEWIDKDVAESFLASMEKIELFGLSTNPVNYYLYTRSNPKKGQKITATNELIDASNFNPAHPTRFVIHGFVQSSSSSMNKEIRDAWLSVGDFNIIIVDWARARFVDYVSSVVAVPTVGRKVATLIDFLVTNYGMSLDTLYVIGHSLGAHVAGYVAKNLKSGQIHTIIGLDPALPLFSYDKPDKRLNSKDAFYVESIQTNGGKLGFLKPIGKAAFYPNGGKTQPNCPLDFLVCSHERSNTYYAEAVTQDKFATIKCNTYIDAIAKNCGATYSAVRMGADTNAFMVEGDFYVPVNKKPPYAIIS